MMMREKKSIIILNLCFFFIMKVEKRKGLEIII